MQAANGRISGQRRKARAAATAEGERDDQGDCGRRGVRTQRVRDPEPAEQRQRPGRDEHQRGEASRAVASREQTGQAERPGECEGGRDHAPSPGWMPASVRTTRMPAISASPAPPGGMTTAP